MFVACYMACVCLIPRMTSYPTHDIISHAWRKNVESYKLFKKGEYRPSRAGCEGLNQLRRCVKDIANRMLPFTNLNVTPINRRSIRYLISSAFQMSITARHCKSQAQLVILKKLRPVFKKLFGYA